MYTRTQCQISHVEQKSTNTHMEIKCKNSECEHDAEDQWQRLEACGSSPSGFALQLCRQIFRVRPSSNLNLPGVRIVTETVPLFSRPGNSVLTCTYRQHSAWLWLPADKGCLFAWLVVFTAPSLEPLTALRHGAAAAGGKRLPYPCLGPWAHSSLI
jgi:hypothetical protein